MSQAVAVSARSRVLMDVVEEHLSEAEFAFSQLERGLQSCLRNLSDLATYPEPSLLSHVDALVVGGTQVRELLLLPALEAADPDDTRPVVAAALPLLRSGHHALLSPLYAHEERAVREAAARAAQLAGGAQLDAWLVAELAKRPSGLTRTGLLQMANSRRVQAPDIMEALQHDDLMLVLAAAQWVRHGHSEMYGPIVHDLLGHPSLDVREAALPAALAWSLPNGWLLCERWALDESERCESAMVLYAGLGGRGEHERLLERLEDPRVRPAVLFALGFTGNAAVLDKLLPYLTSQEPREAALAAQSIALIVGLDLNDEAYLLPDAPAPEEPAAVDDDEDSAPALPPDDELPELEEDLENDLVPQPEDELPAFDAAAVERAVGEASVDVRKRHLAGQPDAIAAYADYLERRPLRCRHPLALLMWIRTGGRAFVDTRALTSVQRAQIERLKAEKWSFKTFAHW